MDKFIKLCECGCGKPAPIAQATHTKHGAIKGMPQRFIKGHSGFIDLAGQRFGRLVVMKRAGSDRFNKTRFLCRCDCGKEFVANGQHIKRGGTKSCGCLHREGNHITHGMSKQPIYAVWFGMVERCEKKNNKNYKYYGARGIRVCERWHKFENFFADMGNPPTPKHTLERKDNDKGYSPDNCVWATMKEQGNNKRNNHIVEFNGQCKTLSQWRESLGMSASTMDYRIRNKWPIDKLLSPVDKSKRPHKFL